MRIHWLQHADFEDLGCIGPWLAARGHAVSGTRLYAGETLPDPAAFDALIVMGGPMNIYEYAAHPWLRTEKALIREAIAQGRRVLGICLGAQLIASTAWAAPITLAEAYGYVDQGEITVDELRHAGDEREPAEHRPDRHGRRGRAHGPGRGRFRDLCTAHHAGRRHGLVRACDEPHPAGPGRGGRLGDHQPVDRPGRSAGAGCTA